MADRWGSPDPRVLHVTEFLQGGIATFMNELLPWQERHFGRGQVALVCPEEQLDCLSPETRGAVQLFPYLRAGRDPASLARLARCYRAVLHDWRPSLVHVHSSFAGVICRLPGLKPDVPLIYCAHGWAFARDDAPWLRHLFAWVERQLQSRADVIVAISHHEKRLAVDAGLDARRIQVVHNGLSDLAEYHERPSRASVRPLRLLFIGRLDRQKGLDWLLELMRSVDPSVVQVDVVGATVHSRDLGGSGTSMNVRFCGWASPKKVDAYLDACDAVIMPSRWEGFGLVAIEAMRKGVPVLVSNRGALPEVIGEDEAGWVFRLDNPDALRKQMSAMTPYELTERGQRGRSRFLKMFDAQRMNEETARVYEKIEPTGSLDRRVRSNGH